MRLVFILIFSSLTGVGSAQTRSDQLISLAKIYRNYHFSNHPTAQVLQQLQKLENPEFGRTVTFLSEVISPQNKITSTTFLTKPDSTTLKNLYIIRSVSWNLSQADPQDNFRLIDSLLFSRVDPLELLATYYDMVFVSVGNKNQPLSLGSTNFNLDDYGLLTDEEKGVFFLVSMDMFGTFIWGYMNVVKPPNYKAALEVIRQYPTYNGAPYYQFQDLNFKDFKLTLDKREPKQSFKEYHINKYLNTLLYHAAALGQKRKYKQEQQQVMLGSILKNESYYKYSRQPETLRNMFKRISTQ